MLLIYTPKITPRITFTFKQFFTRILLVDIQFTSNISEFVAHNGPKITYAKKALGEEFFVQSTGLLEQQGVKDIEINLSNWNDLPCFFKTGLKSAIPFDVFSASFYLLSRYEEYLPHVKDKHERFTAEQSLAFEHDFLEKPLVDIWAFEFRKLLMQKFPNYEFLDKKFEYIATFDIDQAYSFKYKGLIRLLAGSLKDIFTLKFKNFFFRIMVLLKFRKDPFDSFEWLLHLKKKYQFKTIFFFLMADYTTYDKNISFRNMKFRSLIKSIADYSSVGLHPSYYTMRNAKKLKEEKKRLENIINTPVYKSRQHYLRVDTPETYQNLVELEITEDYSMGYANQYGFRASTCTPFYFYDIEYEIQTPLKIYPFAVMDVTLKDYMELSNNKSFKVMLALANEVKKVNGTFVTLFHNETFNPFGRFKGWNVKFAKFVKAISKM